MKLIHYALDFFSFPRLSQAGTKLGVFGRLTVTWLWTDDPEVARQHAELDRTESRNWTKAGDAQATPAFLMEI